MLLSISGVTGLTVTLSIPSTVVSIICCDVLGSIVIFSVVKGTFTITSPKPIYPLSAVYVPFSVIFLSWTAWFTLTVTLSKPV